MKKSYRIAIALAVAGMTFSTAVTSFAAPAVSPNAQLSSYVYDYMETLDGLGYLPDMRIGAKPYDRLQMARWLVKIEAALSRDAAAPVYAKGMVSELRREFAAELQMLDGSGKVPEIQMKELNLQAVHYKGDTLQTDTGSNYCPVYQPLNINNNGYDYGRNINGVLIMKGEGYLSHHTVLSVTPRVAYSADDSGVSLESAYIKTHYNNVAIQVGKNELWWGQGYRGSVGFTNNATPQTSLHLSAVKPHKSKGFFKFLGEIQPSFFYSVLDANRSDVPHPSLVGMRTDFTPSQNFTFAFARTSIIGGKGHSLAGITDYWHFLTGKNSTSSANDKWNSIAGMDFRWRFPHMNGMQFYGEMYGEDQATGQNGLIPLPTNLSFVAGTYIPRLSKDGSWDLRLEGGKTHEEMYLHWAYTEGYTHLGRLMGDAMGNRATRYYGKLTHYHGSGLQLSLHAEHLKMNQDTSSLQKVNSYWLSARKQLDANTAITASAGVAKVEDKGSKKNYLMSLGVTQRF